MVTKFLDNKSNGNVVDELKQSIEKSSKLSIISAYFTIYAYQELKRELSKIESLRFLFTEQNFKKPDEELLRQYYISKKINSNTLFGTEFEIKLKNELNQTTIAKECAQWLKEKAEIKSLKFPNPAQPRLIYVENPTNPNMAISGTVDFTTDGLGATPSNRIDNNICMIGNEETITFLQMFNSYWNNQDFVVDVKEQILEQMKIIYKENTPEFIYFVTLYSVFNDYLDELTEDKILKTRTGFKDTTIWNMLYKFQKDGVIGAIEKIEKHNGCIIADSVGLGKTFTALAIIKYYELRNDRVLVLAPKKLRENWTIYTQNDKRNILANDRFGFDVLNHTDLSRYKGYSGEINLETINWANYDLVVIDESHNFRNNTPRKNTINRYQRLMNDIIKSGVKTKVLMLSATPVNNKMNDIKNIINIITEANYNAFSEIGLNSVETILRNAQRAFNVWAKLPDEERTTARFLDSINLDYFKLLDAITIARSRKHIEKYYDINDIGKFPTRLKPKNIKSNIDMYAEFPPMQDVNTTIKKLNLGIYAPVEYILPSKKAEYSEKYDVAVKDGKSKFTQADREKQLVNLMRVNILKRLESSINSFAITIQNILSTINVALAKIENDEVVYNTDINISDIDLDDNEYEDIMFGKNVKILFKDIDLIRWKQDLLLDKEKLEWLLNEATKIDSSRDSKLNDLKELIANKINSPINGTNKKLIIFSAFADTANYLYSNLADWVKNEFGLYTAMVVGSGNNKSNFPKIKLSDLNAVLTHFSPLSKKREKIYPNIKDEIDILIATDCISEGQNLQDCDYLINYDIHWNPVRIIQRFGRIDRIGSPNDEIQLVNFWPNMELDEYINLEARVQNRMVMLDVSATGEENVISENQSNEMNDLEYRRNQLKNLQEKVMDLEDISGNISITDLTLNDFKIDLMEYMKEHRTELDNAPTGIYSVVNLDTNLQDELQPGVIFTLKQIKDVKTKEQNVLAPYYMVHISYNGEIKYSFMQSKKLLDFYKKLCIGKQDVIADLVKEFNAETKDGCDMATYSKLLKSAIENIVGKKEEAGINSLFSQGGTNFYKTSSSSGSEDFELVSFLVIK